MLKTGEEEQRQLVLDVLPALQQGYDLLEQRQAGRLVEPPKQTALPLRAIWEPAPSTPDDGLTWQQLLEHWLKDRERPAKTTRDVETYVKAITAFLPQVSPAKLTRAQVTEWLRNERETRSNSAKTLEKKGTLVGALFSVAVKDEMLEKNPFAGFDYKRFAAKEGVDDNEDRDPFTMSQIARIFSSNEGLFSPYVYQREFDNRGNRIGTRWLIDEKEAALVREVYARRESGESMHQIAAWLNAEGVPCSRKAISLPERYEIQIGMAD